MREGLLLCLLTTLLWAGEEESRQEKGFIFRSSVQGSVNDLGSILRSDLAAGYDFNRHFGVDVGVPFYFIRPSDTAVNTFGTTSTNGVGNVYANFRLSAPSPVVNYASYLTVTAPTGDRDKGLTTGRATIDWTNHFNRSFSRLTPFGNLGLANTVSDTPFFVRPFSSVGFVTHLEGGATYRILPRLHAGASRYQIVAAGQQRAVSRVVQGRGRRAQAGRGRPFEAPVETVVATDSLNDHGYSAWLGFYPVSRLGLEAGYNRSARYALDSLFFTARFDLGSWISRTRPH